MDAGGPELTALLGLSERGPMSIVFATTYPQRTPALYGLFARRAWIPDYVWGRTDEHLAAPMKEFEDKWGQGNSTDLFVPRLADDQELRRFAGRLKRSSVFSAAAAQTLVGMDHAIDVRQV